MIQAAAPTPLTMLAGLPRCLKINYFLPTASANTGKLCWQQIPRGANLYQPASCNIAVTATAATVTADLHNICRGQVDACIQPGTNTLSAGCARHKCCCTAKTRHLSRRCRHKGLYTYRVLHLTQRADTARIAGRPMRLRQPLS